MFMFDGKLWQEQRERFVQSYKTAARSPEHRLREMLDRWLTADHAVQQTRFANGVTVNLGKHEFLMPDGSRLCRWVSP